MKVNENIQNCAYWVCYHVKMKNTQSYISRQILNNFKTLTMLSIIWSSSPLRNTMLIGWPWKDLDQNVMFKSALEVYLTSVLLVTPIMVSLHVYERKRPTPILSLYADLGKGSRLRCWNYYSLNDGICNIPWQQQL